MSQKKKNRKANPKKFTKRQRERLKEAVRAVELDAFGPGGLLSGQPAKWPPAMPQTLTKRDLKQFEKDIKSMEESPIGQDYLTPLGPALRRAVQASRAWLESYKRLTEKV